MKKSAVYKLAIELVSKNCEGSELVEALRVLMDALQTAEYFEKEEETKK